MYGVKGDVSSVYVGSYKLIVIQRDDLTISYTV